MKRIGRYIVCVLLLCMGYLAQAQQFEKVKLHTGDLLFQNLDCGPLCDAIEGVTQGFEGHKFSHIGLVYIKKDTVYVIEAMGPGVRMVPLQDFTKRSSHKIYAGTLQPEYRELIPGAIKYAIDAMGIAYDDAFLYDNGKYYCSELIYDAFKSANNNKPFFKLEPMTFKQPGTKDFYLAWVDYYAKLNMPVPEKKPGINPAGISRSDKIIILDPLDE